MGLKQGLGLPYTWVILESILQRKEVYHNIEAYILIKPQCEDEMSHTEKKERTIMHIIG